MFDAKNIATELDEHFLSILLKNGDFIYSTIDKIVPNMLLGENNRIIYKAMLTLAKKNTIPSRILVKSTLIKEKNFDKVGGDEYIKQLLLINTAPEELHNIIVEIIESYRKRALLRINLDIPIALDNFPTVDVISTFSSKLNNLISLGNTGKIIRLSERLDETIKAIEERRLKPGVQGITTGFHCINEHTTGYQPTEMWFIGARPSMGKTTYLLKSLYEIAKTEVPVLLINKEMSPLMINERLYSMITKVPLQNIRSGKVSDSDIKLIKEARDLLATLPFYIDNNWEYIGNEHHIYSAIRQYKQMKGIQIVGVDYIQLLVPRGAETTQELGTLSRGLKLLCGELDITSVILSQLNRKVEDRPDRRPLMSDLRQSGYLEEDADYMIGLYRDEVYVSNSPDAGKIEFIIRKARNAPTGEYKLEYDGATVNIYDRRDLAEFVL